MKRVSLAVAIAVSVWANHASASLRLFAYYAPVSARSLGMGGAGSGDLGDVGNATINPGVLPFCRGVGSTIIIAPLSLSSLEYNSTSIMVALGNGSAVRSASGLRFAAGVSWRRENLELPAPANRTISDDIYQLSGGSAYDFAHCRVGVGVSLKQYPVELTTGDTDRSLLVDLGALIEAGPFEVGTFLLTTGVGISGMNNGDPVTDPILGPTDATEVRRIGSTISLSTAATRDTADASGTSAPLVKLTVSFDVDGVVHEESQERQQLGAEASWRNLLFVRLGYVDDDFVVRGARDGTFGGGVRWSRGVFAAMFDFARWPYYHDTYGNVFGLSFVYEL